MPQSLLMVCQRWPAGLALHPAFRIVAGHMFRAGMRELVVGVGAARKFGVTVGSEVRLRDGQWPIVGVFSCGADIIESYLVGDAITVMAAPRRAGFAQVIAQRVDASAYPEFQRWLLENPVGHLPPDPSGSWLAASTRMRISDRLRHHVPAPTPAANPGVRGRCRYGQQHVARFLCQRQGAELRDAARPA